MPSSMQVLNLDTEQDSAQVGEGYSWMMLAVQEMSLASLSAETEELVFTTVDTLRMLVLCVQVNISATDSEINFSHNTTAMTSLFFFLF